MENNNIQFETVSVSSITCEQYVIGTILSYSNFMADAVDMLSDESFTDNKCRECWKIMSSLNNNGIDINIVSVQAESAKTNSYLTAVDLVDIASHVILSELNDYIRRLRELERRRKLKIVGLQIQQLSADELTPIDETLTKARELIDSSMSGEQQHDMKLTDTLVTLSKSINNRLQGKTIKGTHTGFKQLDERGGLHAGDLIIIAGCTSQGKTSLATTITLNAIQAHSKVAYYSLEMTGEQLTARIVSMQSGVSASTMTYGKPSVSDRERIKTAVDILQKDNLIFDDRSTSNIDNILGSIRRMKIRYNIDGAVIDYLQILNVNMKSTVNKEQQMADVARRLKNLAKELQIWIIALSQLNRDRDNPEPTIDRLRDSGQIAEAADTVMLVYRPEYYGRKFPKPFETKETHNAALIDVCKGRNTGTMKFICRFVPELTLFLDGDAGECDISNEPF
jgi:replicative DNA helicase